MPATSKVWVVLNDLQFPFHDAPVLDLVLSFITDLKPYGVVLNGDIIDCYDLSEFSKNPVTANVLLEEQKLAMDLMNELARVTTERWWLGGNHEDRLRRYIWNHAGKLGQFAELDFPKLFKVSECGFKWKPYGHSVDLGRLTVTHGDMVRQGSGASAKAHFGKYGSSVMIGHTHRMGVYFKTDKRGVHGAYENGCLCKLTPEYAHFPDWQQGFSVVHVGEGGWFNVQQVPILGRKRFLYGGRVYGR